MKGSFQKMKGDLQKIKGELQGMKGDCQEMDCDLQGLEHGVKCLVACYVERERRYMFLAERTLKNCGKGK